MLASAQLRTTLPRSVITLATTHIIKRAFHPSKNQLIGASRRKFLIPEKPPPRDEKGRLLPIGQTARPKELPQWKKDLVNKAADNGELNANSTNRWLFAQGLDYYDLLEKPRNYLMPNQPFPMNPYYKPVAPLSNAARNDIFINHSKNPKEYTPLKISEIYKISVKRAEAIIKAKTLELEKYAKGEIVENELATKMDFILGSKDAYHIYSPEVPFEVSVNKGPQRPRFDVSEEDSEFTKKDAAEALNLRPVEKVQEEILKEADDRARDFQDLRDVREGALQTLTHKELVEMAPVIEGPNDALKNERHQFRILDLSSSSDGAADAWGRRSLVRERDGSLREATPPERDEQRKSRKKRQTVHIGKWGFNTFKGDEMFVAKDGSVRRRIVGLRRRAKGLSR